MIALDALRVDGVHPEAPSMLVLYVAGEVDMLTAPALRGLIDGILEHPQSFVLDLSQVTFLDSSGMSVLVELRRRHANRSTNWSFALAGVSGSVETVLRAAQLMSVFPVVESVPHPGGPL